jgi:hypothetical protein
LKKISILRVFEQKFTMGSYRVGIERVWCCQKAWGKSGSRVQRKNTLPISCPNNKQPKFGFKEFQGLKIL